MKWLPLSLSKDHARVDLSEEDQPYDDTASLIYIDLQLKQISPQKYNSNQPKTQTAQIKLSPQKSFRKQNEKNDLSVSPIYEIDLDSSQYDEPKNLSSNSQNMFTLDDKSNYTLKSKGDSPQQQQQQNNPNQSSQVYVKKKKNYTNSANPTIGLIKSPEKQQFAPVLLNIDQNLLTTLQPKVDHITVKNSLIEDLNKGMSSLHEKADKGLSDINAAFSQVKQISATDQQDLVKYSDRDQIIKRIAKVTQSVVSKKQDQQFNRQQMEQQLKETTQNQLLQQRQDQLDQIKALNNKLKDELHHQNGSESALVGDSEKQSAQATQLAEQINNTKQELINTLQQIKKDLLEKSLGNRIGDETEVIFNQHILGKQAEQNKYLEELDQSQKDNAKAIQQLDHDSVQAHTSAKSAELDADRKKIDLVLLNKKILSINNEIKQTDKLYTDIINKLKSKRKGQTQHSDQMKQKIIDLEQELLQNREALSVQRQRLSENELERSNDPQCLSNKDVLASYNKLQENLNLFMEQIQQRNQHVQDLKDIWFTLKLELDQEQVDQLLAVIGNQDKLSEKNQQLLNKIQMLNELAESQDQIAADTEVLTNQTQIQDIFKKAYNVLLNKEKELKDEYQRIKVAANEIVKIREEIDEKLTIQEKDFEEFENERINDNKTIDEQQQIINRQLIQIKSKAELESELRERISQIRELEAVLRGKDHEIDTLELIQSQKDSVILELEEQAGKFKEVVKEVRYESTKHDRVEEELFRYMESHPVKVMIKKLGDGYYKFGSKRIYIKLDSDDETLMVRTGPKEFTTLNAFIIENEGVELQKSNIGKALLTKFKPL